MTVFEKFLECYKKMNNILFIKIRESFLLTNKKGLCILYISDIHS